MLQRVSQTPLQILMALFYDLNAENPILSSYPFTLHPQSNLILHQPPSAEQLTSFHPVAAHTQKGIGRFYG